MWKRISEYLTGPVLFLVMGLGVMGLACGLSGEEIPTAAPTAVVAAAVAETAVPPSAEPPTPTPERSTDSFTPYFEQTSCALEGLPTYVAVVCGYVVVTEDRTADPNDTIRLAVAIYQSVTAPDTAVPTFFLQGGPGSPAVTWSDGFYDAFIYPLLAHGDVIFMDHRGTGLSEPSLNCDEIRNVYIDDFQSDWDTVTRSTNYASAFLSCRTRLIREGVRIRAYTTTEAAADVRDVTAVLGYEQVNLYGVSYGTMLGQAVMRDYPEIVNSAVMDSVVPLEVNFYNDTTRRVNYALETLFAGCAADSRCSDAYPDLEGHFYELLAQFEQEPLALEVQNPDGGEQLEVIVGDSSLINAMVWALHSPSYVSQTPRIIEDVYGGNFEILELLKSLPFSGFSSVNIGLRLSVECHDQVFPTTQEEMEADLMAYPDLAGFGYSAIYGSPEFVFNACNLWGAAGHDPADKAPLESGIPTLIVAGQFDPTTPAYYGRQLADNLPNSYFFEFAGQGHAPSVGIAGNCPQVVVLEFLTDPDSEPDSLCLSNPNSFIFEVPFDGSATVVLVPVFNEVHQLSGVIPTGWVFVGNGFYNRAGYAGDPTQIGFQSSSITAVEWLDFLEENYQYVGLSSSPEAAGNYESNGRVWQLYTADYLGDPVDFAIVEHPDGLAWLVMMTSEPDERETLFETAFLPVIDSIEGLR